MKFPQKPFQRIFYFLKKHFNKIYRILALAGLVTIAIWILFDFSHIAYFFFDTTQQFKGEFVKLIATIIGGVLLLYGLILNERRTKALEEQNKITEKGHVDERFKNAIEHLGNSNSAIVLGGIYSLHRIACDNKAYRATVFDILCSYIRNRTYSTKVWSEYSIEEIEKVTPEILIQTIIDLLFKANSSKDYIYRGLRANLDGIRCFNADFYMANLEHASLNQAFLSGANFREANLDRVSLWQSHLEGADLTQAQLQDSNLVEVHLEGADLYVTKLEGAAFIGAHLEGALFDKAQMQEAEFSEAHIEGASFYKAHLEGAYFPEAHLEGANLREAYMEGTDLKEANMEGANLWNAHLSNTNFLAANMEGTFTDSSFPSFHDAMRSRIGKGSDFSNVIILDQNEDNKTKIFEVVITGVLMKEKADEIIERYNKAMVNVPKRKLFLSVEMN